MDSYRLVINNYDLSTSNIEESTSCTGFTVVKAPKGPCHPVLIPKGGDAKIRDIFGVANGDYPELYEVTEFNKNYDIYVSAPYAEASVPAALITTKGIFLSSNNLEYNTAVEDYVDGRTSELSSTWKGVQGDNTPGILASVFKSKTYWDTGADVENGAISLITFEGESYKKALEIPTGLTMSELKDNKFKTLRLSNLPNLGHVDIELKVSDTAPTLKIGTTGVGYFAKTEDKYTVDSTAAAGNSKISLILHGDTATSNAISFSDDYIDSYFADNQLSSNLNKLKAYWVIDDSAIEVRGYIFPKYPSTRTLHLSFENFNDNKGYSSSDLASRNILKISAYEDEAFHNASHPVSVTGSLDTTATDANGKYIGFTAANDTLADQNLICVYSEGGKGYLASDPLFPAGYNHPSIILEGGMKSVESTEEDIYTKGWTEAQDEEYSNVDIFFDSQRHSEENSRINDTFLSLYNFHPLAGYIFNKTLAPSDVKKEKSLEVLSYGENYWNVCNEANIELSNHATILSPMTGAKSAMQCRIIESRWGGVAPMYLNSGTPSVGGQLSLTGLKNLRYKYNKDQQKILDDKNYNPIVLDHGYGIMSTSQKTCKSGAVTDWSYIGHVCSFLNFQKEVRTNVMIPQLGKANNPYYRTLRKEQVLQLLSKRLSGNNRIWAEASVDTSTADGVNDIAAQKARKFIILVKVKVDTYSEYVTLNFTNVDQSMTV